MEAISIIVDPVDEPAPEAPEEYTGALVPGTSATGQVSALGLPGSSDPTLSDYWLFEANAGDSVTIEVHRNEHDLDPSFWIFEGVVDEVDLGPTIDFSDPGVIDFADDEIPHPGPFGDPHLTFTAPSTGLYTAIVTNYASGPDHGGDGQFDYTIEYLL